MPARIYLQRLIILLAMLPTAMFSVNVLGQEWDFSSVPASHAPYLKSAQNRAIAESQFARDRFNDKALFDQPTTISQAASRGSSNLFNTAAALPQETNHFVAPQAQNWDAPVFEQRENLFAASRFHFQFAIDGVALSRGAPTGGTFVIDDNGPALSYEDVSLDLELGPRFRGGLYLDNEAGFEFVYFELESASSNTVAGPNVLPIFFNAIPAEPQPSYDVQYDSDLESVEFNFWCLSSETWRFGLGYRRIELQENFNIIRTFDPTIGFFSNTFNTMNGVQLLTERRFNCTELIQLFAVGKFGFFNNESQVDGYASNAEVHDTDDTFAFLADINAGLRLTINQYAQMHVGYQAMLFTGVAVAPEQSAAYDIITETGTTEYGNAPFHGFSFGATLAY